MPTAFQPPAPLRRDPALDGLRGLAVLLVFLFHYGGGLRASNPVLRALGYLTQAGWIGVDLFFALSGFLITGLLAETLLSAFTGDDHSVPQRRHALRNLGNFYARRALRILPLYLAALLACAVAALLTGRSVAALKPLLVYLAFLQNLPPLLNTALHTPPPLPVFHLWSLAVEEQFYLLWPFALLAARTPRGAFHLSLLTFAASCLFRAVVFAPHLFPWDVASSFATLLPTRAGALALGSALALYPRRHDPTRRSLRARSETTSLSPRVTIALIGLSCALILLVALHTGNLLLSSRTAFLLTLPAADVLSAALVALCLQPNPFRAVLSLHAVTFLGRISYGFYVLHILLEPLFDHLGSLLTHTHAGFAYQTARLLTALPITTGLAWLSFLFLERPFLRLKRRFPRSSASAA